MEEKNRETEGEAVLAIVPKQLVIVGAGKIAKSYLADIFGVDAGYHIVFLTHHALQARQMREAGSYTLFRTHADGSFTRVKIADYDAFGTVSYTHLTLPTIA